MKDELNRSYNGGGVVYVLKVRHLDQHDSIVILIHIQKSNFFTKRFYIHKKQKTQSCLRTE